MLGEVLYGSVTVGDVLFAALIIFGALVVAKIISLFFYRQFKRSKDRYTVDLAVKTIKYGLLVVALITVMPTLGFNLSGLLVAGGVTGIVIGFASQNIISNLVSGVFLMIERPLKIGQQVQIDQTFGYVEDINILSTVIQTYDGLFVRIPNETVFTNLITNLVSHVARRFQYIIAIRYGDDMERAMKVIQKVINDHPLALKEPLPQVFVSKLGESGAHITVRIWCLAEDWYSTKMELLARMKHGLEDYGIRMALPQRVVWYGERQELMEPEASRTREVHSEE